MILLVDINPIIERRLSGGDFPKGKVSYADKLEVLPCGQGVDLANISLNLKEETALMAFLGGTNGDLFARKFLSSNIRLFIEKLRDESQERICLEEKYKETRVYTREPRLTREDIMDFYKLFQENISQFDTIVLTENSRSENPDKIELGLIKLARGASVPIVCPLNLKDDFQEIIEARPFGLVINRKDLESILGQEIHYMGQVIEGLKQTTQGKIPLVLVCGGKSGTILYTGDRIYYGKTNHPEEPEIDPGKAMLGLALGISRRYDPEMTLKMTVATGMPPWDEKNYAEIKAEMNKIKVEIMEV